MIFKATRTQAIARREQFVAKGNFPGFNLPGMEDHGYGPLAAVIESLLEPGTLIKFHEHVQDEIISWVPRGVMRHNDHVNGPLVIDAQHLMVMNAGSGFWHEEQTREDDAPLRMLQIFVRPPEDNLKPEVQFGPVPESVDNKWRYLVGPPGSDAPFYVRNAVHFFDAVLSTGASLELPAHKGWATYFLVFEGHVEACGEQFAEGESGLLLSTSLTEVTAKSDTLLVAFLVDPNAPLRRTGSSGDGESVRAAAATIRAAAPIGRYRGRKQALVDKHG